MIRGKGSYVDGERVVVCLDSEALVKACQRCAFSLVCLSGKQVYAYICSECGTFWVDDYTAQIDCDAFQSDIGHDMMPGCPACEPFEHDPQKITKILGYQGEEYKEEREGDDGAADEE